MNQTHCQYCGYDLNDPDNCCAKCEDRTGKGLATKLKVSEVKLVEKDESQPPSPLSKRNRRLMVGIG